MRDANRIEGELPHSHQFFPRAPSRTIHGIVNVTLLTVTGKGLLLASLTLGDWRRAIFEGEFSMKKHDYLALALAAVILAIIFAISPKVGTIADEASIGLYGIDISGLTRNARHLPEEDYPAY
jgi:hypothetical protein